MSKSKLFWIGAICLAIIPWLAMDIPKDYVDWMREVPNQINDIVFGNYQLNNSQKWEVVTQINNSNIKLLAKIAVEVILSIALLICGILLFVKAKSNSSGAFWKKVSSVSFLLLLSIGLKSYSWYSFNGNEHIRLITMTPTDSTLESIYTKNLKGKVVYVDFWGTTCPPCLNEFRMFTKPLKERLHKNKDIAYLYICGGHKFVWQQQLKKFDISGSHLFLESEAYDAMYRKAAKLDKKETVYMPRYLIINKQGQIVNTTAPPPSEPDSIYKILNKYLASN